MSTDRARYVTAFVSVLEQFMAQLRAAFPEEAKLRQQQRMLAMLLQANPSLVIRTFQQNVQPYKDAIKNRDEAFFLQSGLDDVDQLAAQYDMLSVLRMRELWHVMSDGTRAATWQYVQVLVSAAEKATGA
jgi:uncharacterized protein YdgA (DUF945 family)